MSSEIVSSLILFKSYGNLGSKNEEPSDWRKRFRFCFFFCRTGFKFCNFRSIAENFGTTMCSYVELHIVLLI